MLALFAAREAAVIASGHGTSLTAPIGTGTVDGFAAGIALSGVVFMLILAQRRALRAPARAEARAEANATPPERTSQAQALDDALGQNAAQPLAAPVEMAGPEMAGPAPVEAAALALVGAAAAAAESAASAPIEVPAFMPVDTVAPALADSPPWAPVGEPGYSALMEATPNMAFSAPVADESQADAAPALSTHPYADVSPYGGVRSSTMSSRTESMPFADAANEVLLQPGVRLEEWLEGQMRRPSLPRTSRAPVAEHDEMKAPVPVPSAVAAAEATTAVVPATPAPEAVQAVEEDDAAHHRRASAYQSKHRLAGRNDSKPGSENHRRPARHAAASSARPGAMSRMFSLRQLRPVGAGD